MRILVVEDSAVSREFILESIRHCEVLGDYRVDYAETGEKAYEMFTEALVSGDGYDLAFLDIILPGMDGLQLLEKIRANEANLNLDEDRRVKVIMATALDDEKKATRAFFQGQAVSYITKPLTEEKINTELNKFGFKATRQ